MKADEVRRFWEQASEQERDADNLRPTARDPWLQECVEHAISSHLPAASSLLDIGCGDGHSTLRFARHVARVHGVDYVDRYVTRARAAAAQAGVTNATFSQADVTNLADVREQHGRFGAVSTIRCLINLPEPALQAEAIRQIALSLEPGGVYLASEGWTEGMAGLNQRRTAAGLAPIEVAQYNLLLSRRFFEAEAAQWFQPAGYVNLGLYLFLSRVAHPLLVHPERPSHDHALNRIAAGLQRSAPGSDFPDCDYGGVYVFRRLG